MSPTVGEALRAATQKLRAAGVPDPARDARRLLAAALGVEPGRLIVMQDDVAPEGFDASVAARARRVPVSQIVGWREFYGRRFKVTSDVLDPRPETETLVDLALAGPFDRVLDLGTGTGCLLLTLLAERGGASGLGVDASPAALKIAGANAAALGLSDRVSLVQSDWFSAVAGRFDLIVSNPPYIAADEMAGLAPEVRDHEPRMALTDEGDGLSAYRAIAAGLPAHLAPGGRLLVEIGAAQGASVAAIFRQAGLEDVAVHPDLDGRERVVAARASTG